MLQQRSTLKSKAHRCTLPFYKGAGGEWNSGTLLCSDGISTGWHLYQTLAKRKIQFLDRKARYEKHVSGNAKTFDRGRGRVKIATIMSSITTQQTKLDLELIPKEKRLEIEKCNGRLTPGMKPREPTFQVILDALSLTSCYSTIQIGQEEEIQTHFEILRDIFKIYPRVQGQNFDALPTAEEIISFLRELGHTKEINSLNDVIVDQMHQPWRTFAALINRSLSGKTTGLDKLRLSRAQILWDMSCTSKDCKEIPETSLPKKDINMNLVPVDEEPIKKNTRVKRSAKKSTTTPTAGVVIKDTPDVSVSKKKTPANGERGKGIALLSEVALSKKSQFEEVYMKSMRDFHRTHPSGSGAAKIKPSGNDEDDNNNDNNSESDDSDGENESDDENTKSDNENESDSEQETDENETCSESDKQENEEEVKEDDEEEDEFVKTPSNYTPTDDEDETNVESKAEDNAEGDEDEEMDYTTSLLYDDVDVRRNNPVHTDEGFVQQEGTDAEMINIQQGNENLEIIHDQVIKDAHLTISTAANKTDVPVTSSSHSSDLSAKFLNLQIFPLQMQKLFLQWLFLFIMRYQTLKLPHSFQYRFLSSQPFHNHYHPSYLHLNYQHPHHHQQLKQQILNLHFLTSHPSSDSTT
ncbi:hypothetical protein Tco_0319779 [Tanacetum coccineum]